MGKGASESEALACMVLSLHARAKVIPDWTWKVLVLRCAWLEITKLAIENFWILTDSVPAISSPLCLIKCRRSAIIKSKFHLRNNPRSFRRKWNLNKTDRNSARASGFIHTPELEPDNRKWLFISVNWTCTLLQKVKQVLITSIILYEYTGKNYLYRKDSRPSLLFQWQKP